MLLRLVAAAALLAIGSAVSNVGTRLRGGLSSEEAGLTAFVQTGAKWRFGSNYVPQHYGSWKFEKGVWNFGSDKRIECEACGYVMYMLVDQLGDSFDRKSLTGTMEKLCMNGKVQWVFQSACNHILKTYSNEVVQGIMRLSEPEEICKQITLCTGDMYDHAKTGLHPAVAAGLQGGMYGPPTGGPISLGHPGGYQQQDGTMGPYPAPGSRPITEQSPYSPYSFGGYDSFGYPQPHSGVPSSTPLPPEMEHPPKGSGAAAPPAF